MISIVVAMDENGVIGDGQELPWRLKDDMLWFKQITSNKPIIMGRKTYQSIGKPLPSRENIVLTRDENFKDDRVKIFNTAEDGLDYAYDYIHSKAMDEICVIGGAEIYNKFLPIVDRIYLTKIQASVSGDIKLELPVDNWEKIELSKIHKNENNQYSAIIEQWNKIL